MNLNKDQNHSIPEFAILGHPNEGKSSVVSTLTEDDSVRISPYPGETMECRVFPVSIDGVDIIRFIDTPGFQAPRQTLTWLERYVGPVHVALNAFIRENRENTLFRDECELLKPLADGAGIIYVADGSRPVRSADIAEMKILSMMDRPKLGIINNKTGDVTYTGEWEKAFEGYFDAVCDFNAHKASYLERIQLLEKLKSVQKSNSEAISEVITAYKNEWSRRNALTAELIVNLAEQALVHQIKSRTPDSARKEEEKKRLQNQWSQDIKRFEKKAHDSIRSLFRHNIFNILLPEHSPLSSDLFDSTTWKVLGLSKKELAATAASIGAASAAVFDLAIAGHSYGLFALIGGIAGGASALLGADKIGQAKILGKKLGNYRIKVGPSKNIQLMFILIDRALIFYSHIINWAHGKRDQHPKKIPSDSRAHTGYASSWDKSIKNDLTAFFSLIHSSKTGKKDEAKKKAVDTLKHVLDALPYRTV